MNKPQHLMICQSCNKLMFVNDEDIEYTSTDEVKPVLCPSCYGFMKAITAKDIFHDIK